MKIDAGLKKGIGIICVILLLIKGVSYLLHEIAMQKLESFPEYQMLLNQYLPSSAKGYVFKINNDKEIDKLEGKVRFVKFETKRYEKLGNMKPIPIEFINSGYYEYDSLGNKTIEFYAGLYSSICKKYKYSYIGNFKSKEYIISGNDTTKIQYTPDYENYAITKVIYHKNGQSAKRTIYDQRGRGIVYQVKDSTGFVTLKAWEYDSYGNRIRMNEYRDSTLSSYEVWEYDRNNRMIKEEVYLKYYGKYSEKSNIYNEFGDVISCEESLYNGDRCLYEYANIKKDSCGNILFKDIYKDGELSSCMTAEYAYYE